MWDGWAGGVKVKESGVRGVRGASRAPLPAPSSQSGASARATRPRRRRLRASKEGHSRPSLTHLGPAYRVESKFLPFQKIYSSKSTWRGIVRGYFSNIFRNISIQRKSPLVPSKKYFPE